MIGENEMENIDISKLDKAEVLASLYNRSKVQGMGCFRAVDGCMTKEQAQKLLDNGQTYFDYIHGKIMKVDLSGNELETYLYDRDNGEGAANMAINHLLK